MTIQNASPEAERVPRGHHEDAGDGFRSKDPIAIIGLSCKFGGEATSASKLWDLCTGADDCWTPIPPERFDVEALYDKRKGKLGRVCIPDPGKWRPQLMIII